MCSGRRECKIHIPNTSFDRIQPCPTDLKAYLQPAFQCLKGLHLFNNILLLFFFLFALVSKGKQCLQCDR